MASRIIGEDEVEVCSSIPQVTRDANKGAPHDTPHAASAVFDLGNKPPVGKVAAAPGKVWLYVEGLCRARLKELDPSSLPSIFLPYVSDFLIAVLSRSHTYTKQSTPAVSLSDAKCAVREVVSPVRLLCRKLLFKRPAQILTDDFVHHLASAVFALDNILSEPVHDHRRSVLQFELEGQVPDFIMAKEAVSWFSTVAGSHVS